MNGTVELEYQTIGDQSGEPMLLIMGLGMQMIGWPEGLCELLTGAGFAVARFDNRDAGLSTHFRAAGAPPLAKTLLRPAASAIYQVEDMAADALAVLDGLGWGSAHIVGASLGGMIAQSLTIRHPDRVRSLTSLMSTPYQRIGRPTARALRALLSKPAFDRSGAQDRAVAAWRVIGSPAYPIDEAWIRDLVGRSYDRSYDPAGAARQLAAIRASPDRRPGLAHVRVPTLVMHGEADQLVRPAGGRATAAAVPGARLVTFPGMGHDLPLPLWPMCVAEIAENALGQSGAAA